MIRLVISFGQGEEGVQELLLPVTTEIIDQTHATTTIIYYHWPIRSIYRYTV